MLHKYEFNGKIIVRGKVVSYKKSLIARNERSFIKILKKSFIKENKLDKNERLVLLAKQIKVKEDILE